MRLLFVSHSFAPEEAPLSNVGGMQRVAMELYEHLDNDPRVEVHQLVLRAPWRMIVPRAMVFLASLLYRLPRLVKRHDIDVVLFSSITTAFPVMRIGKRLRRQGCTLASIAHGLDVTEPNFAEGALDIEG